MPLSENNYLQQSPALRFNLIIFNVVSFSLPIFSKFLNFNERKRKKRRNE